MKAKALQKKSFRKYNLSSPYEASEKPKALKGKAYESEDDDDDDDEEEIYEEEGEEEGEEEEDLPILEDGEEEYVYGDEDDGGVATGGFSLADLIMQKLKEKESRDKQANENDVSATKGLSMRIIEVYTSVGDLLSKYRSGKLPKAVKVLPHLKNWEEILAVTNPVTWSPAGTYALTKVFASNLNAKLVQRFFNLVLLDKCRNDIEEHGKLNFHLYHALKKSLFKPSAFYKGIVLPLLYSGTCTQREATIFSSVLAKVSIPAIHSAALILKMLDIPYSIPVCIFLKQILMKKYAFPARVIDSICNYFTLFADRDDTFPVIWHQTLLAFVQRYKHQLHKSSQRDQLFHLLQVHSHHEISNEIRRELSSLEF